MSALIPLLPLFLAASFLYSSVGHGGASAYLAILVLAGYPRQDIAPTVLVLNILVALLGSINYFRAGHFKIRLLFPFILTSIPAAFLGGSMRVSEKTFSAILGFALLAAAFRFLFFTKPIEGREEMTPQMVFAIGLPVGAVLGFLSGLIGIGGGIFLSPLLLLMKWADAKKTAAVSAVFIVLNSISGLTAQLSRVTFDWSRMGILVATVLIGGGIGSYTGAFRLLPVTLQRLLGVVLLAASAKLLIDLI